MLVLSVGARGPLGLSSLQLAMAARARKLAPARSSFVDRRGHPVGLCLTGGIPDTVVGFERLVALAGAALREAWIAAPMAEPRPLFLALAEATRPDADGQPDEAMLVALARDSRVPLDVGRSRVFRGGQAAGAFAIAAARAYLQDAGQERACAWIGGVDSYVHPNLVGWLDAERRLHAPGTENGFIPSEGAAFALLGSHDGRGEAPRADDVRREPLARVAHVATALEESATNGEPNLASAMTALVEEAARTLDSDGALWVLTDLNGERHRAREWAMVEVRTADRRERIHQQFASDLGDLGAATGPMLLAIAVEHWRARCAPAAKALVALHSDGPARGLYLLEQQPLHVVGPATRREASRPLSTISERPVEPPVASPAGGAAALARDAVEATLFELRTVGIGAELVASSGALAGARAALSELADSSIDDPGHLERLDRALERIRQVCDALERLTEAASARQAARRLRSFEGLLRRQRGATIRLVVARQDYVARLRSDGVPRGRPPYVASQGVPSLHGIEPAQLVSLFEAALEGSGPVAHLGAEPEEAELEAAESAQAELEEADSAQAGSEQAESAQAGHEQAESAQVGHEQAQIQQLRWIARDCMQDVGALGVLRTSSASDRRTAPAAGRFEQRLLRDFDALVALATPFVTRSTAGWTEARAPVLDDVLRYSAEAPVPDPARAFVRSFVLCSVAGPSAVRLAVRALRQSHPSTWAAQAEAFALASNPDVAEVLRPLCSEGDPLLARFAFDVLRARGEPPFSAACLALLHPEPNVRASAGRCLGLVAERAAARTALRKALEGELEERVGAALAESLLLLGSSDGLSVVRRWLQEELAAPSFLAPDARARLAMLLAIAGDEADGTLLLGLFEAAPAQPAALGWFGHPRAVEPLLQALGTVAGVGGSGSVREASEIAEALHRITGAWPMGEHNGGAVAIDADGRIDDDACTARAVDTSAWERWWHENRARIPTDCRLRFGEPYTPMSSLQEIARDDVATAVKEICALELACASGLPPLRTRDWTSRLHQTIDAYRAWLSAATELSGGTADPPGFPVEPPVMVSYPPGRWPGAVRLRRPT